MAAAVLIAAAGILMIIGFSQQGSCNCPKCANGVPTQFAADAGSMTMTAKQADDIKAGKGDHVIMFFKPGCPPCEQTKPAFIKASSVKTKIPLLLANITEPHVQGLAQKFQITGVPHLAHIRGGEQVDVLRDRAHDAIVAFANK